MDEQTQEPIFESKESVEVELTAKGLYKWTIKLREDFLSVAGLERMKLLTENLKLIYPNNVMNVPNTKWRNAQNATEMTWKCERLH